LTKISDLMQLMKGNKERLQFHLKANNSHSMSKPRKSEKELIFKIFSISSRKLSRIASISRTTSRLASFLNFSKLMRNRKSINTKLICGLVTHAQLSA